MFKRKVPSGPIEKGRLEEDKGSQAAPRPEKPSAEHSIIPADLKITGDLVSSGDIHVEGVIHRPQYPPPNRSPGQVALIEHRVRPHGGMDRRVLAVLLHEEAGGAVCVDGDHWCHIRLTAASASEAVMSGRAR